MYIVQSAKTLFTQSPLQKCLQTTFECPDWSDVDIELFDCAYLASELQTYDGAYLASELSLSSS